MEENKEKRTTKQFRTMLMAYPRLVEDLHEWQRRQWHVIYYAFLLLGGITYVHEMHKIREKIWPDCRATSLCLLVWLLRRFPAETLLPFG